MATDMVTNGSDVAGKVKVVLGAQWGDEGKGKLVDLLAEHADVVARCQVINRFSPNFSHFIHIFRFCQFCQGIPDCVHFSADFCPISSKCPILIICPCPDLNDFIIRIKK